MNHLGSSCHGGGVLLWSSVAGLQHPPPALPPSSTPCMQPPRTLLSLSATVGKCLNILRCSLFGPLFSLLRNVSPQDITDGNSSVFPTYAFYIYILFRFSSCCKRVCLEYVILPLPEAETSQQTKHFIQGSKIWDFHFSGINR